MYLYSKPHANTYIEIIRIFLDLYIIRYFSNDNDDDDDDWTMNFNQFSVSVAIESS